jgi:hypothetical protein
MDYVGSTRSGSDYWQLGSDEINILPVKSTRENRSFDHFLGWLLGADGQLNGTYTNRDGKAWSNYHLTYYQGCGCDDPDHAYLGARTSLNPATMGRQLTGNDLLDDLGVFLELLLDQLLHVSPDPLTLLRIRARIVLQTTGHKPVQQFSSCFWRGTSKIPGAAS